MSALTDAMLVPALQRLADTFGHALTPAQLEGYVDALSDLPVERVLDACQAVTRTERFWPKPAVLRERASLSRVPVPPVPRRGTWAETWVNPRTGATEEIFRCGACEDAGWVPVAARGTTEADHDPRPLTGGRLLRWVDVRDGERHSCVRRCECRRSVA